MAKRTVIAPDEELLIQGKLTVTGNVYQVETTQTVNRFESDELVINADNSAANAKIILNSTSAAGSLTFDGTSLIIDVPVIINSTNASEMDIKGDVYASDDTLLVDHTAKSFIGTVTSIANHDTGDLAEGTNLYFTTARARGTISHSNVSGDGSIAYNSATGVISYTGPSAAETRAHFSASNGVSYNSSAGAFQAVESEIQHDSLDGFIADEHVAHSGVSIIAGSGLTGGGTIAASRTLNVVGGFGITVNANDITVTNSEIRSLISVTDAGGDGSLSYNSATGVITYTGPSAAEARAHISVTDAGGDGSLSYNSTTGVITYTGPSQAEVNSRINNYLTGGDGINYATGTIDVDSTVVRTSGTQTVAGDKTFTGTTTVSGDILPSAANTYNLGSWENHFDQVFANVLHAEKLDLGDADLTDIHSTFYAGTPTGTILDTNTAGGLVYAQNSPGDTNPGGYYRVNPGDGIQISSEAVAVDSTVVRTNATQSVTGTTTFTDIVVPTRTQNDNSTKAASTAYVDLAVANLIDGAPGALDTLNELANALNDDASIGSTVTTNTSRITNLENRDLIAGDGITGGGDLTADRTFAVDSSVARTTTDFVAGSGLTGGGTLASNRTFNVGAGNGITVNTDSVQTDDVYIKGLFSASGDLSYNSTSGQFSVTTYKTADFSTDFATKTTTQLAEGTNLYYTQARFDTAFGNKTTTDLTEGTNLYYTDSRVNAHLSGSNGVHYSDGAISVDSTVVRTTSEDQSIAGNISFTGELIMPQNGISPANDGSIYHNNIDVFAVINGSAVKLTPQSDVGEIEDAGGGEVDIYAGFRTVALGNANVKYHGIKSVSSDAYIDLSEASNVITVSANTSQFTSLARTGVSAVDNGGYGSFSYNNTTGAFSYTGPSTADIRGELSGTGLISYNTSTGEISTTADNYDNWKFTTGSAGNVNVNSGDLLTFQGTSGVSVSHTGSTITIAGLSADITSVGAGSGLTGGGNSGDVTVNVGSGYGITVNTNNIETNNSHIRALFSASGDVSYNNGTGVISFTERTDAQVRGLISVSDLGGDGSLSYNSATGAISYTGPSASEVRAHISASGDLSYNSTTGVISFTERTDAQVRGLISATGDISYNSALGEISYTAPTSLSEFSNDTNFITLTSISATGDISYNNTTGVISFTERTDAEVRGLISATGDISYNSTTGVFSFTERSDAEVNTLIDNRVTQTFVNNLNVDADTLDGNDSAHYLNASNLTGTLASARLPDLTVADFDTAAIQTSAEAFSDSDAVLMTASAIEDRILSKNYSTTTGTVTQINGGSGLTPASITTTGTLAVGAGNYILVGADDVSVDATSANTAGKVVARDGSGNFAAGVITATATAAQYADLAENYVADALYEPGTVLVFGGEHEVTESSTHDSPRVAGVISTDPAHLMNSTCEGEHVVAIALRGRIPCKVVGPVRKGDVLITSTVPGHAEASSQPHFVSASCIVGKAISSKDTDGPGIVEIMV